MKTFDSMADEDWRIGVDACCLEEPYIVRPDSHRLGCFAGPLVTVHVNDLTENDDGYEMLDLEGVGDRNLFAVTCLPHFAQLFRWIKQNIGKLGVSESAEYNNFVDSLCDRVDWITALIDERDHEITEDCMRTISLSRFGE